MRALIEDTADSFVSVFGGFKVFFNFCFRDVEDPLVDEINLCICHHDDSTTFGESSSRSQSEKTGALKG